MDFYVRVGPYALCEGRKKIIREVIYNNSCDCDDRLKHIEGKFCSECGQEAKSVVVLEEDYSNLCEEIEARGERVTSLDITVKSQIWRSNIGINWDEISFSKYSDTEGLDLTSTSIEKAILSFERQHVDDIELLKEHYDSVEIKYGAYAEYN